jgi:hypothetical protein
MIVFDTTLTNLIDAYFRRLLTSQSTENAPIVRRLSGTLAMDVSPRDYKKHLEEKYARYAESSK